MTWHEIRIPAQSPDFISPAIEFQFPPLIISLFRRVNSSFAFLFVSLRNPNPIPRDRRSCVRRCSGCLIAGLAMKGGKSNSKKGDNKLAVKRKGAATTKAAKKAAKDPNKPKRPPSAFFVFMEEFRKHYKEKHPSNKSVAVVGKAGGDKWKSLTDDEKAPYISKAEKRKADYEKTMKAYNKKQAEAPKAVEEDEDSDKSRSEVNDDEDDEDEEGSGEEDDDE
ncbi:HMG1/2-like protein isoform X2 [Malania oleifera]|uniref:HMG1/2-like protein isoform X2 n=1 Tax=Malania oleifera TaxID=397392 RepID=UPI0025AE2C31|nr:HMG1/2-like protein isoform X2 [Malania oleifera]